MYAALYILKSISNSASNYNGFLVVNTLAPLHHGRNLGYSYTSFTTLYSFYADNYIILDYLCMIMYIFNIGLYCCYYLTSLHFRTILPLSSHRCTILINECPLSILLTCLPIPLIYTAITIIELPITIPHIILILT